MLHSIASRVVLFALWLTACAAPGAPGPGTASREALEGCRAQAARLDVWCGDVVFAAFNRPGRTDVAQGLLGLTRLLQEVSGTDVVVEEGPVPRRLQEAEVLRLRYRYTWEGRPYLAQALGRVTPTGSFITDCAAPADKPEAIARCGDIVRRVLTRPFEEVNRHVVPEEGVSRPRPRFDDPARSCKKEEREGRAGYACADGSGLLVLTPREGAADPEPLAQLLRERGASETWDEGLCVVMGKPGRCRRYACSEGRQLVVAPLEGAPPGTAVCVIPTEHGEDPWVCEPVFQVLPER